LNAIDGSIAAAEFEMGRTSAVDRLRKATFNARELGDDYAASMLALPLGRGLLKLGNTDSAREALAPAIEYFRARSMSPYLAHALDLSADIGDAAGDAAAARAARDEAMGLRATLNVPSTTPPAMQKAGA
jgi:hypothetical protein